jgi:hypothetical protein
MTRALSAALLLVPVLWLVEGCAKPPAEKLAAAEKAVEEARAAGAPLYVGEDFAKVEGMLAGAKSDMAAQDGKMVLLRDYAKAEQGFIAVQGEAARVTAEAAKKKEEAKQAALQGQQAAQAAVRSAQELLARAPVGKDRAALEAIKADAEGLKNSLAEVQSAIDKGDYQAAQARSRAIREKGQAVAAEIQTAIDKTTPGKGAKGKPPKK